MSKVLKYKVKLLKEQQEVLVEQIQYLTTQFSEMKDIFNDMGVAVTKLEAEREVVSTVGFTQNQQENEK